MIDQSLSMEARLDRERTFHNKAFSEGTRDCVEKVYDVSRASREEYARFLKAHAPASRVLEYGCGPGSQAFFLGHHGATVSGIDISDVAVAQAADRARHEGLDDVDFRVMNAESLDYDDNSFDLICGTGILHHLDLRRAFSEISRTLRPGGSAIFVEPLGHNPVINLFRRSTPGLRTVDEHPLRMGELKMARQYFASVQTRFFHLHSLLAVPLYRSRGFDSALRILDAADRLLFKLAPPARKFAWQVMLILSNPKKHAAIGPMAANTLS